MYKAIIEIPKGSSRRIHHKYDKSCFHDFGPLVEKIPINKGKIPINYGYLKNYFNKKEKDELDVLVFSKKKFETGDKVYVNPIAILKREDGDDKVVAVDKTFKETKDFDDIPEKELITRFFSHHHRISSVLNKKDTTSYLKKIRNHKKLIR